MSLYRGFDGFFGIVSALNDASERIDFGSTMFNVSWHRLSQYWYEQLCQAKRCPGLMMPLADEEGAGTRLSMRRRMLQSWIFTLRYISGHVALILCFIWAFIELRFVILAYCTVIWTIDCSLMSSKLGSLAERPGLAFRRWTTDSHTSYICRG